MNNNRLRSEIEFVLSNSNHHWEAGRTLILDFLRNLHEVMTKSERNQTDLLSQVLTVFDLATMHHLARLINASTNGVSAYASDDSCPLHIKTTTSCISRGFSISDGNFVLAHFLKTLDERRYNSVRNMESETVMTYWCIGAEAAYHLGGLNTGDHLFGIATELEYLDPQLKRYKKLVELWEMELAFQRVENL